MPHLLPNIFLFVVTYAAGLLAMRVRLIDDKKMHLLLAFSGSFLLSITFLHLIPETIEDQGHKAGFYILIGFFLQLFIAVYKQLFFNAKMQSHVEHVQRNFFCSKCR